MKRYKVTGKLYWLEFCDCEHCGGHEHDRKVDVIVDGDLEQQEHELKDDVLKELGLWNKWDTDPEAYEWDDVQFVNLNDPETAKVMAEKERAAMGYPTLFDVDLFLCGQPSQ